MDNIITIQGTPAPDCKKCGSRVLEDKETGKLYTCECAYPEDCPIKKPKCKICASTDIEMKGMCHECLVETYVGGNHR